MKIIKHYCDFCKRETSFNKRISLNYQYIFFNFLSNLIIRQSDIPILEGDICRDCFESYKKWVKSRMIKEY